MPHCYTVSISWTTCRLPICVGYMKMMRVSLLCHWKRRGISNQRRRHNTYFYRGDYGRSGKWAGWPVGREQDLSCGNGVYVQKFRRQDLCGYGDKWRFPVQILCDICLASYRKRYGCGEQFWNVILFRLKDDFKDRVQSFSAFCPFFCLFYIKGVEVICWIS